MRVWVISPHRLIALELLSPFHLSLFLLQSLLSPGVERNICLLSKHFHVREMVMVMAVMEMVMALTGSGSNTHSKNIFPSLYVIYIGT